MNTCGNREMKFLKIRPAPNKMDRAKKGKGNDWYFFAVEIFIWRDLKKTKENVLRRWCQWNRSQIIADPPWQPADWMLLTFYLYARFLIESSWAKEKILWRSEIWAFTFVRELLLESGNSYVVCVYCALNCQPLKSIFFGEGGDNDASLWRKSSRII